MNSWSDEGEVTRPLAEAIWLRPAGGVCDVPDPLVELALSVGQLASAEMPFTIINSGRLILYVRQLVC